MANTFPRLREKRISQPQLISHFFSFQRTCSCSHIYANRRPSRGRPGCLAQVPQTHFSPDLGGSYSLPQQRRDPFCPRLTQSAREATTAISSLTVDGRRLAGQPGFFSFFPNFFLPRILSSHSSKPQTLSRSPKEPALNVIDGGYIFFNSFPPPPTYLPSCVFGQALKKYFSQTDAARPWGKNYFLPYKVRHFALGKKFFLGQNHHFGRPRHDVVLEQKNIFARGIPSVKKSFVGENFLICSRLALCQKFFGQGKSSFFQALKNISLGKMLTFPALENFWTFIFSVLGQGKKIFGSDFPSLLPWGKIFLRGKLSCCQALKKILGLEKYSFALGKKIFSLTKFINFLGQKKFWPWKIPHFWLGKKFLLLENLTFLGEKFSFYPALKNILTMSGDQKFSLCPTFGQNFPLVKNQFPTLFEKICFLADVS